MQEVKDEKKFRIHYIGRDGNTPVCRNMLLTRLDKLIPAIGDNEHCETPLWYRKEGEYVILYAQLSDEVAVATLGRFVVAPSAIEEMTTSDAYYDAKVEEHVKKAANDLSNHYTQERLDKIRENFKRFYEVEKQQRDARLYRMHLLQNYTKLLLDGLWITESAIRAYEEVGSPYLPVLQELRRQALEDAERKERWRKQEEEEQRKKEEAKAKEQPWLTGEAEKFKGGASITGKDVVELCRRYGIKVHPRTVYSLQQVVQNINGKTGQCVYYLINGRKPVLEGCYKTARELYEYLQTHEIA